MPKKNPHHFSEQELREGYKKCIENVRGLLASAKILNDYAETEQYALGLYMYAVEEYGKAILLSNSITASGTGQTYLIDKWILGDGKANNHTRSHDEKINIGLDNLPSDCRTVRLTVATPSTRTVTLGMDNQISSPESTTGSYLDTTDEKRFVYSLDLKTACFYVDWNENNKDWKYRIPTQPKDLKKYIKCLEDALASNN